jgi:phage host-nuclease inhibitor protein Gam
MNEIKSKINKLADFHAVKNQLERMKEDAKAKILTPELLQQLQDIDDEYATQFDGVNANIADLEKEIKADVIAHGETVKGDFMQACWTKPRVSWDTKQLDGYAAAHPEIEKFRKVGDPSVSIRWLKGK